MGAILQLTLKVHLDWAVETIFNSIFPMVLVALSVLLPKELAIPMPEAAKLK